MDIRTEVLKLELVKGMQDLIDTVKNMPEEDVQKLYTNTLVKKVEMMFPVGTVVGASPDVVRFAISIQSLNSVQQ